MNRPPLAEALSRADLIHDAATLDAAITRLAPQIDAALAGERAVFLTVMHGGLPFAAKLALAMKTDMEFDYLHATRYRGQTSGSEIHWLRQPAVDLAGRTVVLADDILDEGKTLKVIRDFCVDRGARRVLVAVLCEKRHGRCIEGITADFCGVEVPDRYVFGYGMDYYEQGRNLPGIYAI
ncbi:hypoxanthine-guanine phosphoribosyltransferase [Tahibacter amnicola]|uniref:Hypoxanthine-guanine phosphoribosyltransferase n=1 Tax=Tahibacter amnicola TaxID=2976241 RepID=A0ABY6BJV7_9GAMM|nr:hypoxanthine-guanine phosphoribosyltransferase [Tahibacter amnicola]UXI69673.1 hypoxanthine-guanine phosphoribosyltransferase [Tahibacter amnicola]